MSEHSSVPSSPEAEEQVPEEESLLLRLVPRPDLFDLVTSRLGHRDYLRLAQASHELHDRISGTPRYEALSELKEHCSIDLSKEWSLLSPAERLFKKPPRFGPRVNRREIDLTMPIPQAVKMSTKGWDAYFKVIRFLPERDRIAKVRIGRVVTSRAWLAAQHGGAAVGPNPADAPTVKLVLRKMCVEEGTGMVPEPTLHLSGGTPLEIHAWVLQQLRGAKKRVHLVLGDAFAWGETELGVAELVSELSHHLPSGTFASLDLWNTFPMPAEITEALSVSRGLRSLTLPYWTQHYNSEFESLAGALSSPAATHSIATIRTGHTLVFYPGVAPICHVWDFLDIPSLRHLYVGLPEVARDLTSQVGEIEIHLHGRIRHGLAPLQTLEFRHWVHLSSFQELVAKVAEASPTTVLKG